MTFFFFNAPPTPEIYTLSLHDALPISTLQYNDRAPSFERLVLRSLPGTCSGQVLPRHTRGSPRSEEHTSELQSRQYLVCRLLLEKKKKKSHKITRTN